MRVSCNVDRLGSRERPVIVDGLVHRRGGVGSRLVGQRGQNRRLLFLLRIKIAGGVPGAIQESEEHEKGSAAQQRMLAPTVVSAHLGFKGIGTATAKIFP